MAPDSPAAPTRDADTAPSAYEALHAEREAIERGLSLAKARQRFSADDGEVARARDDEAAMLRNLDRVLTQIRAAEVRRRPGARRW